MSNANEKVRAIRKFVQDARLWLSSHAENARPGWMVAQLPEVEDAIATLATPPESAQEKWRPFATLPKDGGWYRLLHKDGRVIRGGMDEHLVYDGSGWLSVDQFTHWTHEAASPEPPTAAEDGGGWTRERIEAIAARVRRSGDTEAADLILLQMDAGIEAEQEMIDATEPASQEVLADRITDHLCEQEYDIGGRDELRQHVADAITAVKPAAQEGELRAKPCPFAVFDEHGNSADDRVWDYATGEVRRIAQPVGEVDEAAVERACKAFPVWAYQSISEDARSVFRMHMRAALNAARLPAGVEARQKCEYHEDMGPVTWWAWCGRDWAGEPAWIGTPSDSDWPGYHTHFTPHPPVPPLRTANSEAAALTPAGSGEVGA